MAEYSEIMRQLQSRFPSQTHKLSRFAECWEQVKDLEGDLAEFGVYNGNGARELSVFGRRVWAFDTFDGMPPEDYNGQEDNSDPVGKWKPLVSDPSELFRGIPNITPVKGRFAMTLGQMPKDLKLVLVHIDCDWYQSYRQVYKFLESHLVPGAICLVDDYGPCQGAIRATDEWLAEMGPKVKWTKDSQEIVWRRQHE